MNAEQREQLNRQLVAWQKEAEVAKRPSQRAKAERMVRRLQRELHRGFAGNLDNTICTKEVL